MYARTFREFFRFLRGAACHILTGLQSLKTTEAPIEHVGVWVGVFTM